MDKASGSKQPPGFFSQYDGLIDPKAWKKVHALGLPAGSIRALLAFIIFGGIWVWLYRQPDIEVPSYLQNLMFVVMGHYFAARHQKQDAAEGPSPLWLPKGVVRFLFVAGFLGVAAVLFHEGRMHFQFAGMTLILVAGFLFGVLMTRITGRMKLPRIVEDVRAVVSLAAAALLVALLFKLTALPESLIEQHLIKLRAEDILAAVVGFYFGSRS